MSNPSNKSYLIKYAAGGGQIMTLENSETEEGKAALDFAKAAGEEVTLMDTDTAIDKFFELLEEEVPKDGVH